MQLGSLPVYLKRFDFRAFGEWHLATRLQKKVIHFPCRAGSEKHVMLVFATQKASAFRGFPTHLSQISSFFQSSFNLALWTLRLCRNVRLMNRIFRASVLETIHI